MIDKPRQRLIRFISCALLCLVSPTVAGETFFARPDSAGIHLSVRELDEQSVTRLQMPTKMGVEVLYVAEGSVAARFGLRVHDVIFLVENQPIRSLSDFREKTTQLKAGKQISLAIFRDSAEIILKDQVDEPDLAGSLKLFSLLANHPDPFYQYSLGRYFEGRDDEQALRWHRLAANQNHRPSMIRLGMYFYRPRSGKPDYVEARKWFDQGLTGTSEDDPEAVHQAGMLLLKGRVGNPDFPRGLRLLTQAAGQDFHWSWVELGDIYRYGIKDWVERDPEKAFRCYQRAVELKNPLAPYFLGECYELGIGVEQDYPNALANYQKVPTWPAALTRLGTFYQFGFAVKKDLGKAREYYEKAAKMGDGFAANNLGGMYEMGLGVKQDLNLAIEHYTMASQKGGIRAYDNLGRIYSDETNGITDFSKARANYQAAARAGVTGAMVSLGFLHVDGKGGEKSYAEALRWFQIAAERGDAGGASALGMMYENGWAVPKDRAEAIAWYLKAADGNDQWAITRLKELRPKYSPAAKP